MQQTYRLAFFRIFLLGFVILPTMVEAQDNPETPGETSAPIIGIRPSDKPDGSRFEAQVEPGQSHEFTVVVGNYGLEPIELRTYVADISAGINGGMLMADSSAERTGITLWLDYPTEELALEPGVEIELPMIVTVPENAEPGQYVTAVALETINPVQELGSFNQYFRKVVSIYTLVPGDLSTEFELGEPEVLYDQNRPFVVIPIANTGGLRIDLSGTYILQNRQGDVIGEGSIQLAPIYMGHETNIYIPLSTPPPAGDYVVGFEFLDSSSGISVGSDEVSIMVSEPPVRDEVVSVSFENIDVTANDEPIVFANVSVDVVSGQKSQSSTRLTLSIYHNGAHVEDLVLAENLSVGVNDSITVSQRYLPATNWESGTYTFSLKLESTSGGQISLLLEEEDVATLEVP